MTRSEAISFIHKQIKESDESKLRNIICSCFGPLCSSDCPLKDNNSTECKKIETEEK